MGGDPGWGSLPGLARRLEDAGWDALLVPEHHDDTDLYCRSPLVAAAAALGATRRLAVGPGVLPISLYRERVIPEIETYLELAGDRALLGLGAGFWSEDFRVLGLDRPASWVELRGLVERLLAGGLQADQILLGVRQHDNIRWAGEHGIGVLIGGAWAPMAQFSRSADVYDEARGGDHSKGVLAAIAGVTLGGGDRVRDPDDEVPVPPARDGLWWDRSPRELLDRADLLVLAPYSDGVGSLEQLLRRIE
jgi:alkanesulfonate monooxygenase SsuD/methylene tetrahydromethanopterin reductase-like flavin-dependent oxidoreductase (luciferase family)